MILLDTSAWIDLFSKRPQYRPEVNEFLKFATCPPVLQEVLQGIKDDLVYKKVRERFHGLPCVETNLHADLFLDAADLFRQARKRGVTIRSSVDCLIAAIAIKHDLPIWHYDRDFDQIAKFTKLTIWKPKVSV